MWWVDGVRDVLIAGVLVSWFWGWGNLGDWLDGAPSAQSRLWLQDMMDS